VPGEDRPSVFDWGDLAGWDPEARLGAPGHVPYTRGIHPGMYRDRLWTMRQYAGFGTAEETNARFHFLLGAGQTGLSCAFDLPTQMGYDSDHPRAQGEVGRVGVAIATLDDMRRLLAGIPLDQVTTSMTINATAPILLLLYQLVAEEQGAAAEQLRGTVQNDPLKEYIARGTYIYPPRASMRLVTDTIAYCLERLPHWNTVSVSGYHLREAGSTAAQELAFTLADGIAYLDAAVQRGLDVDQVAPRLSFFFNAHSDLFEEAAKFRAARRMWWRITTERFGARSEASTKLRFHAQTAGSTLTAQQPEVNTVRVALQALAAVLGGAQSLHTNASDEALGLPSEASARLALRTQQVLAYESGVTAAVDPLGGSYYVEVLTETVEAEAWRLLVQIDRLGGAVAAIEAGYQQGEIERSAYAVATAVERGEQVVVGVNRFAEPDQALPVPTLTVDPEHQRMQLERVRRYKADRDQEATAKALAAVEGTAAGDGNLLPPMKEALRLGATLGEVSDALRRVFGEHHPAR
jgi:methylmalonyl-CoA mutase N-terminal domain/subunit